MIKSIAICSLLIVGAILVVGVIAQPSWLSDKNDFLRDLSGRDILHVLGVILAITLASAAQLHLEFNKIEEQAKHKILKKARGGVHGAAYGLIGLFVVAAVLSLVKEIILDSETAQATINASDIFILFFNVIILIEITQTAFAIPPMLDE